MPDSRIIAGIEASMITSLGTWRLLMPLSELTMARAGRLAYSAWMSALIAAFSASGSVSILVIISPTPVSGSTPIFFSVAPCFLNTSAKNTDTQWPNRMGSEIFIMVVLRCSENRMPSFFAASIALLKKASSALAFITEQSMISPALSGILGLSTVVVPSLATSSMRAVVGADMVVATSEP